MQTTATKERLRNLLARTDLQRPQDAAGFWLWRAAHAFQREVDRTLEPLGLTHLQFVILVEIAWFGSRQDEVNQQDIVSLGTIHLAQVSAVLKKLQGNGLVEQRKSERDRRARVVWLTPTGTEVLARALPAMSQLQRHLFAGGTGTPLIDLLGKLLAEWNQARPPEIAPA